MKVLLAAQYYYPYRSGLTEYARLLSEGLVERGHKVTVLTSRSSRDFLSEETVAGVQIIRLPVFFRMNRGSFMPGFLPALARLKGSYDIINLHFPMPECLPAAFLLRNKKLIVTYHCDLTLQGGIVLQFLQGVYFNSLHYSLHYPKAVVASGLDYAESSALCAYMDKVIPIPPPIRLLSRKDPSGFKSRFKITGSPVIGFLGRVVFEKGLEDLVYAMDNIIAQFPDAVLVIAGEKEKAVGGTVTERVLELARRHKDRVILTGFLADDLLEEFYSACDVFVLPSTDRLEAFGMVQVEAMLCGIPVVASDRPGMRLPIQLTKMGRLVAPHNPRALAEGIVKVLKNRDHYRIDRSRILEQFSAARTVEAYEDLFSKIS